MKRFASKIIDKAHKLIHCTEFCKRHKTTDESFTRIRCMGFTGVVTLCLNFLRKSLQIEIDRFMELTDSELEKPMTKQAFSKARRKISPDAFKELFGMTGQTALEEDAFGRFKGYRIFAVDGTELQLPKSAELSGRFRQTRGSFSPHARVSTLCDVITGLTVHAVLDTAENSERYPAMNHLNYFAAFKRPKDVIVFERGYPSKALIQYLQTNGFKYLMRLQKSFNAEIDRSDKRDFYVNIAGCKVRVIKLTLSNGEGETLITNLGGLRLECQNSGSYTA